MNIDEIIVRHSTLTNGTAGLLISLITCSETAVPIRIGSISLYFPDCMFGEDRSRLTVGCETNSDFAHVYLYYIILKTALFTQYTSHGVFWKFVSLDDAMGGNGCPMMTQ